jgi:hypothetical protein
MPRLTITIPTVNRAYIVGRAIESALAQTSTDIEILVSDNGSGDDTPAVIARYAGRGLRTFRHESTMSAYKHGEFLLEQTRGEFMVSLSDDDYLQPEFAAEILAAFDRHPESVFVYTGGVIHYEDIQVPAVVGPGLESGAEFMAKHYEGKRDVIWCACALRTADLRELNPLRPEDWIAGDMFFWTKLAFRGPVGCVSRELAHYILLRQQNDNMSHGTSPVIWAKEQRLMADEVIQALRQTNYSPESLSALEPQITRHLARSIANQFVWTRIRGARRTDALAWSTACLPYLSWDWPVISRLGAAMILPGTVLKKIWLKGAAGVAASRREMQQNPVAD